MSPEPNIRTLIIDGVDISASADQTILEAARDHNIPIPTLCQIDGLSSVGSCRLCLVEVKGARRLLPACVTRVEEGMEVTTHSPKIDRYRAMVLELLFAERNHVCSVCAANGTCELQDLALSLGVTHIELPYQYPQLPVDASHPRFTVDHNRCVLCSRCVRVCSEVEGANTWGIMGRGAQSLVITDLKEPWGQSETCTSCGKCVQVCPTGALLEKNRAGSKVRKHPEFLPYLRIMREGEQL